MKNIKDFTEIDIDATVIEIIMDNDNIDKDYFYYLIQNI